MSAPLSPERETEIREHLGSTLAVRKSDVEALLAELNRLRSETAGLRQGIERQEARTEHIAKQALRWKAEADGRKKYGEKLRAELAALPAPVVETAFRDGLGNVWPLGHFPAETEALVLKTTPTLQRTVRISEWTEVAS
ncbi:hypothetical protein [Streptomyces sp. PA03-2a]|uniref:hypothetical protein n=1 Tax=Streptomyces sp. PA03-2a TaxID=3028701 RepID=UPI0029B85994|nr:hypothetical protein [Streptomyces sp. PA03-2a]MDX2732823.1 hypothetical protein [Streptomyces sp. PA03-2a]